MHITIEDNYLVYIYLKEQSKYVDNIGGESSVRCFCSMIMLVIGLALE